MSVWQRLQGLRDAPRGAASLVAGELAREVDERVRRAIRMGKPEKAREPRTPNRHDNKPAAIGS